MCFTVAHVFLAEVSSPAHRTRPQRVTFRRGAEDDLDRLDQMGTDERARGDPGGRHQHLAL
jgi:hypothetical protein